MKKLFKHPWAIVAVMGAITVFFALQLPRARIENDNIRFVPADDAAKLFEEKIETEFGNQSILMIGFERRNGTVFDGEFLARLRAFEAAALSVQRIEEVTSIISADYIEGTDDSIVVSPLVPATFAGTPEETATLREKIMSWDIYRKSLVSEDLTATQVIATVNDSTDPSVPGDKVAAYHELKRLAAELFPEDNVYFAGMTVLSSTASGTMKKDIALLLPLVLLVVILVLFLSFRNLQGVLLPLATTVAATIWSIGAMPLLNIPLSIISIVLPVILIAVGSAYGIHFVSHYYDDIRDGKTMSRDEHRELVIGIVRKIGFPIFLAGLTTFAGFISFCFTTVIPVKEFGAFASFGVFAAIVMSVTLIPALLIIRGPARAKPGAKKQAHALDDFLSENLLAASKRKGMILALAGMAAIISVFGVDRLVIDNVMVEYFKDDNEVVKADRYIREKFGGSKSLSVIVSHSTPGEVLRPDVLAAMDSLAAYIGKEVPEVGKVMGFPDMIKRVNQVVNAGADPSGLPMAGGGVAFEAVPAFDPISSDFGFEGYDASADTAVTNAGSASEGLDSLPPAGVTGSNESMASADVVGLLKESILFFGLVDVSANELVRGLERAVNYKGAAYYEIPADPVRYGKTSPAELKNIVSNYLVLLSSGDLSAYANDPLEPTAIRMNLQLRTKGQIDTDSAVGKIQAYVNTVFPNDVTVEIGGKAMVEKSLNVRIVQAQLISVVASLAMVFAFLAFFYRSFAAGLIGLIPLGISILIDFAVMGFAGIKLNIGTSMVASISVGIGIDYTIHSIDAFRREFSAADSLDDCVRRAFGSSSKAIVFNALSVALGFSVLAASRFTILSNLGTIVSISMITSALASLTLLPALLVLFRPAFIFKSNKDLPVAAIELVSEVM